MRVTMSSFVRFTTFTSMIWVVSAGGLSLKTNCEDYCEKNSKLEIICKSEIYSLSDLNIKLKDENKELKTRIMNYSLVYSTESLSCNHMGTYICFLKDQPTVNTSVNVTISKCGPTLCPETNKKKTFSPDFPARVIFSLCVISYPRPVITQAHRFNISVEPEDENVLYYSILFQLDVTESDYGDVTFIIKSHKAITYMISILKPGQKNRSTVSTQTTKGLISSITSTLMTSTTTVLMTSSTVQTTKTSTLFVSPLLNGRLTTSLTTVTKEVKNYERILKSSHTENTMLGVLIIAVIVVTAMSTIFVVMVFKLKERRKQTEETSNRSSESAPMSVPATAAPDHIYINTTAHFSDNDSVNTEKLSPNHKPGRYISEHGLIYVQPVFTGGKRKQKSAQTKGKCKDMLLYAKLDFSKTGKYVVGKGSSQKLSSKKSQVHKHKVCDGP